MNDVLFADQLRPRTRCFSPTSTEELLGMIIALRSFGKVLLMNGDLMSSLRFDPTTNDWVILAPERTRRPHELGPEKPETGSANSSASCPFCPSNERLTAPEIFSLRDGQGWHVRVIPNKFPALRIEESNHRQEESPLFRSMGGCGAHEVIIESPNHALFLGQQPVAQIERVLFTLQARFLDLMRDARFQTIVIFKNHGTKAGTSLRHPHWQLIATPVVPRLLRIKHAVATDYFDLTGHCLYCVLLEEEMIADKRVLAVNDHFAAVMPFASHVPFETWILPRKHQSSFGQIEQTQLPSLAELLKNVLLKMDVGLEDPGFNLTINTAPRGDEGKGYFLWHMQILPRLTTPAGFEMGSGMAINTVLPETAAEFLRKVTVS